MYSYQITSTLLTNLRSVIKLLRPYQWSKNILVFSGLMFSGFLFDYDKLMSSTIAFAVFCLITSSVYIINDLADIELDKKHPEKSKRPLASGQVSVQIAIILLSLLLLTGILGAYLFLSKKFLSIALFYLFLNVCYSFGLKKIVILDVMIVSTGFLLRTVAGCAAIDVQASSWLYLCTLVLALFMSFGKRRNEIVVLGEKASTHRSNLQQYSINFLELMMAICATAAIITYSLYAINHATYHYRFVKLTYTIPLVMFNVFRYFYLVEKKNNGGDPTLLLMHDSPSIISGFIWIISVVTVIYFHDEISEILINLSN